MIPTQYIRTYKLFIEILVTPFQYQKKKKPEILDKINETTYSKNSFLMIKTF